MTDVPADLTAEEWESRVVPWAGIGAGPAPGSRWIGVSATSVLLEAGGWLPRGDSPDDVGLAVAGAIEPLFVGVLGGEEVWAVDVVGAGDDHEPVDLMSLYGRTSERRSSAGDPTASRALFPAVGRKVGRAALRTETDPQGLVHGTVDDLARTRLLAVLGEVLDGDRLATEVAELYRYGDDAERRVAGSFAGR